MRNKLVLISLCIIVLFSMVIYADKYNVFYNQSSQDNQYYVQADSSHNFLSFNFSTPYIPYNLTNISLILRRNTHPNSSLYLYLYDTYDNQTPKTNLSQLYIIENSSINTTLTEYTYQLDGYTLKPLTDYAFVFYTDTNNSNTYGIGVENGGTTYSGTFSGGTFPPFNGETQSIYFEAYGETDFYTLDNCSNASLIFINFTVYDETNQSIIPMDIEGTFNYTINSTNGYKQFDIDIEDQTNFTMCAFPLDATFTGDFTLYYSNTNYPQRTYIENTMSLTNTTSHIHLYTLHDNNVIPALFQVFDSNGNPLVDVDITVQLSIGGTLYKVDSSTTDDAGIVTSFLNPDKTYTITFIKTGYETQVISRRATSSDIIPVIMGLITPPINLSYSTGIRYLFRPESTILSNNTFYNFTFNLTSSLWDITNCRLYLKNGSTILSTDANYNSTHCNISINFNTSNYLDILSEAIYSLNGTNFTVSKEYSIISTYEGNFSIKNFLDDLKSFSGLGFNDFTRMIIAFIVICALIFAVASKQGLGFQNEEGLIIFTVVLVWGFSYIEWLTLNYGPIPTDWLKQYIIAIIITLAGAGYMVKKHID